jgi:hypothetical protein
MSSWEFSGLPDNSEDISVLPPSRIKEADPLHSSVKETKYAIATKDCHFQRS